VQKSDKNSVAKCPGQKNQRNPSTTTAKMWHATDDNTSPQRHSL